jgi:hypothetical protein
MFKVKITTAQITIGPTDQDVDILTAQTWVTYLMSQGYRRISNAYCRIARIDRDDWLDVLAKERHCSRADFYNVDGSGIGDQHRDSYLRRYSKDVQTVHPAVLRAISSY